MTTMTEFVQVTISCFRPYFSYWVTFVQIVIFIVSVSVYGYAPIGIGVYKESKNVSFFKETLKFFLFVFLFNPSGAFY